jgi:hypothetical protein
VKVDPNRYRSVETDHYRQTTDTLRRRAFDTFDGHMTLNQTIRRPEDQFYYSPSHVCNDTVGFRMRENPLFVSHEVGTPPLVSFTAQHTRPVFDLDGFHFEDREDRRIYEGWGPLAHNVSTDEPTESDSEFITRAIAGLNPSRASASGAVFMAELRELPSLFQNLGEEIAERGFLRGNASAHLSVQFGWAPVIRDLRKFMTLADKVRRRVEELKELRGTGKLRREFKEKDGRGTQVKVATIRHSEALNIGLGGIPNEDQTIWYDVHTEMRTTRWAVIEFLNDFPDVLISNSDGKRWDEAHRLVFGTQIDGPTIWQAMPWSWLIDWTSNMSEFVKSQNNVAGHKLGETILMKETQRVSTISPVLDEDPGFNGQWSYTLIPGSLETITKERILGIRPTVKYTDESMAILGNEFKTSILSALFVQKVGKHIRLPKI